MSFNALGFLLGRVIAQNRGTTSSQASSDGLVGGIIANPRDRSVAEETFVGAVAIPSPTITSISAAGRQVTFHGSGFGTTASDIDVLFRFVDSTGFVKTTVSVQLQSVPVTPAEFTMTLPPGVPTNRPVSIVVLVQSRASDVFETTIP